MKDREGQMLIDKNLVYAIVYTKLENYNIYRVREHVKCFFNFRKLRFEDEYKFGYAEDKECTKAYINFGDHETRDIISCRRGCYVILYDVKFNLITTRTFKSDDEMFKYIEENGFNKFI
jgi:hypothetical protein